MIERFTLLNILVLALATFRLTHLIVYDKIAQFIRRPFIEIRTESDGETGELRERMQIKGTGLRHWMGSLLSCHWCTGIWCATLVVLIFLYLPACFPVLVILAIAGVAAIIETYIP